MPAKEIKELRQSGKLEEALYMAKAELEVQPDNIWAKRNISWVYYEYLKQNVNPDHIDSFIFYLSEIKSKNSNNIPKTSITFHYDEVIYKEILNKISENK